MGTKSLRKSILAALALAAALHAQTMETLADMPSNLRESIEWVWAQRISPRSATAPIGEGSVTRRNLITDQIYAAGGSLNYVVRWQSGRTLSRTERQGLETMLDRHINNWFKHLINYDNWPYGHIPVRIVGWAVADASLILDRQPNEIVYTDWSVDAVHAEDANVPERLPDAPSTCWRFEHFTQANYTYPNCPGGPQNRFDMYLWATASWRGGVGGDWGQRLSDNAIIGAINQTENTIISHEMGHGVGITDFYGDAERPPNGFPTPLIMWAGNSPTVTDWDKWMLRYIWSQLRLDTGRFPYRAPVGTSSSSSSLASSSSATPLSSSAPSSSSSTPIPVSSSSAPVTCATLTPYHNINAGAWTRDSLVNLTAGDALIIGPQPVTTTGWTWSGPEGFSATTREIRFTDIRPEQAGVYTATYSAGTCQSSLNFTVTVVPATVGLRTAQSALVASDLPHFLVTDLKGSVVWNGPAGDFNAILQQRGNLPRGVYLVQSHHAGIWQQRMVTAP